MDWILDHLPQLLGAWCLFGLMVYLFGPIAGSLATVAAVFLVYAASLIGVGSSGH